MTTAATRPTRDQLAAAHGTTIPDVIAPGLDVLFCGINPGLYSGHTRLHFARPGNRFWPALHRSGFTPRLLRPDEQHLLTGWGLGITNIVARATARADELTPDELREGGAALARRIAEYRPAMVAVLGVTAYRGAFGRPKAVVGPQPEGLADTPLWVLPNPSGLNAHWTPDAIAAELRRVREAARSHRGPSTGTDSRDRFG
ncbi:G/U mismatch-specific DNA glycosylase [Nocardiopsis sediminis]|uniref:G/U mismatch-specific DNA glycosylase n=1 Tax=Nocardiopsis sediminis TaxID=1778267 RepID=A0ABV8FR49_9ACTN